MERLPTCRLLRALQGQRLLTTGRMRPFYVALMLEAVLSRQQSRRRPRREHLQPLPPFPRVSIS